MEGSRWRGRMEGVRKMWMVTKGGICTVDDFRSR